MSRQMPVFTKLNLGLSQFSIISKRDEALGTVLKSSPAEKSAGYYLVWVGGGEVWEGNGNKQHYST